MEKILISSCLLGKATRWHGKKVSITKYVKELIQKAGKGELEIIEACPELLGGLSVPRIPVKRRGCRVWETCEDKKNRNNVTGKELTKEFLTGAEKTLNICKNNNIKKAVLCKWSPSCDIKGITGKLLNEKGIEVVNI